MCSCAERICACAVSCARSPWEVNETPLYDAMLAATAACNADELVAVAADAPNEDAIERLARIIESAATAERQAVAIRLRAERGYKRARGSRR